MLSDSPALPAPLSQRLIEKVQRFVPLDWFRRPRVRGALVAGALASVLVAAALLPRADVVPFICLFRVVTTAPCPSCGMTHAFVALGHGRASDAFAANFAGPFVFIGFAVVAGLAIAQAVSGRDVLGPMWARGRRFVAVAVVVLLATAWTLNLLARFGGGGAS